MVSLNEEVNWAKQMASANPSTPNALDDLNSQLYSVYSSLTDLNNTQTNALANQNNIKNIVEKEASRLQSKKEQIDQAAKNQKRLIYFNDNSRKVYAAYLKIMVVTVITLAIVWVIRVINFHFGEFIPDFVTNILFISTIAIGLIIIYNYYVAIMSRDPYNFDELKLDPPAPLATPSPEDLVASNYEGSSTCIGQKCCSSSTQWDSTQSKCVTPTVAAFTLMYEPAEPYGLL
jgi:ABC-type multidrug transport system fused ATPase/permease subunit